MITIILIFHTIICVVTTVVYNLAVKECTQLKLPITDEFSSIKNYIEGVSGC